MGILKGIYYLVENNLKSKPILSFSHLSLHGVIAT